mmetsp:Transcript_23517/g.45665  ORF Transcript_23517/g.45665 Transcript_23517/m.45665 type:complete len:399 (-) Transcript_23517:502-1698(-)
MHSLHHVVLGNGGGSLRDRAIEGKGGKTADHSMRRDHRGEAGQREDHGGGCVDHCLEGGRVCGGVRCRGKALSEESHHSELAGAFGVASHAQLTLIKRQHPRHVHCDQRTNILHVVGDPPGLNATDSEGKLDSLPAGHAGGVHIDPAQVVADGEEGVLLRFTHRVDEWIQAAPKLGVEDIEGAFALVTARSRSQHLSSALHGNKIVRQRHALVVINLKLDQRLHPRLITRHAVAVAALRTNPPELIGQHVVAKCPVADANVIADVREHARNLGPAVGRGNIVAVEVHQGVRGTRLGAVLAGGELGDARGLHCLIHVCVIGPGLPIVNGAAREVIRNRHERVRGNDIAAGARGILHRVRRGRRNIHHTLGVLHQRRHGCAVCAVGVLEALRVHHGKIAH